MNRSTTEATVTGPQWTDVLRTVPGARLRLSLALKPAWRELLQRWLSTRGLELEPLEGAAAEVVRLDAQGGLLRLCAASTDIEVELHHGDDGVRRCAAARGTARATGRSTCHSCRCSARVRARPSCRARWTERACRG
jgi:hypothetical protein